MAAPAQTTPDRMPEGWGRVADAYDRVVAPFLANYARDALRLAEVRAGERVLDVAAGSGALSLHAARLGARVLATDFAPEMVARLRERAKEAGLDVRAEVMDGQALDVAEGSFDAAFSNFGLIFFPDREAGFRELRRALREGGRAAVTGWSAPERIEWMAMFGEALHEAAPDLPPPPAPPAVFSLADPRAFAQEMRAAGFRDVRVETVRHVWEMPNVEASLAAMFDTNPVVPAMAARLGPEGTRALRAALERRLRALAPEGTLRMSGEAHVGIGRR